MRYHSAMRDSIFFSGLMKVMLFLILIPPILVLIIYAVLTAGSTEAVPLSMQLPFLALPVVTMFMFFFLRYVTKRQTSTEIEVTELGIQHLAPGSPRNIDWSEITGAKKIIMSRRMPAIRLKTTGKNYLFDVYLVPDEPDAPSVSFKLSGVKWKTKDGQLLPVNLENSAGYKILKQYRPELIEDLK